MKEGLSIIIPTLNEEKYVGKLLNCLCNQTYKNFEVIVVDGYSDDKTKQVVNKFKKKLDLKLINSEKRNLSYQRNIGVKRAGCQNLIFIDSDTIFNKDLLKNLLEYIKKKKVAIAGIKTKIECGNLWENAFFFSINFVFKTSSYFKPYSLGAFIYCKKSLHNKIKGFKNIFAENFEYISKAREQGKFGYITRCFVYTSPRRFHKCGTRKTIKLWLKSFFYHFFTNKNLQISYGYSYEK